MVSPRNDLTDRHNDDSEFVVYRRKFERARVKQKAQIWVNRTPDDVISTEPARLARSTRSRRALAHSQQDPGTLVKFNYFFIMRAGMRQLAHMRRHHKHQIQIHSDVIYMLNHTICYILQHFTANRRCCDPLLPR